MTQLNVQKCSHIFATRKANLIVGSWDGHSPGMSHMRWMMDMYRWQVVQGRFFVERFSGKLFRNAEFCAMKSIMVSSVDGWRRSSRIVKRYCGSDTWVEASVDSNWLFAGA